MRHHATPAPHPWLASILAIIAAALLSACGTTQMVTNVAPTAQAAATLAATNVPPGAGSTAVSAATMVATNVPSGAGATVAAVATAAAPTVNAAVNGVADGAQATATALAGSSGTPGPEATITGKVTKIDPNASTFTVRTSDGTTYDFLARTSSRVDFTALARNLAMQQQVTVTYRDTTPPYEVISVS
jgi:hypothetical protein